MYKGSAPRRLTQPATLTQGKTQLKNVKGVEIRGPRFGATSDLIMLRATCAELIGLCCAVCLLAMPRSGRQYGVIPPPHMTEKGQSSVESKLKILAVYTRTYRHLVPDTFRMLPGKCMFEREHSAVRHSTAPQGKKHGIARRRTTLRCAAELIAGQSCAGSSFFVI